MTTLNAPPKPSNPTPLRNRLRPILTLVSVLVLTSLAVGATWQHVATARSQTSNPPPGELIDVGGRDLHLVVAGDGEGPVIVLESGVLGFSAQWAWVQQELATTHTVVAYDRPGQGWSDPDPGGVDPERLVTDLHTALHRQGLDGPLVLVGHSFGGLIVRTFADRYPDEVAGMVLVDSSHPDQHHGPAPIGGPALRLLGRIGALRASGALTRQAAGLPADTLAAATPVLDTTDHVEGTARELEAFARFSRSASAADDLGALPLTVVTAGSHHGEWQDLQRDLADLSPSSRHVVVADATHLSLVTDRDDARSVAAEIADLAGRAG